jgi:hypothetical protein
MERNKMMLSDILESHAAWLKTGKGVRANLHGADLSGANLRRANLRDANLRAANLRDANLRRANLRDADLSRANLSRANLRDANLRDANLRGANLRGANLRGADLRGADLRDADLRGADLRGADLRDADLRGADLSGVCGLLDPADWIHKNFKLNGNGNLICYKTFGHHYNTPNKWNLIPGEYITESVQYHRTQDCGCGVNVATLRWVKENNIPGLEIWECEIEPIDLLTVVVPYSTDGKFRAGRVKLVRVLENVYGKEQDDAKN